MEFSPKAKEGLANYVYCLIDPRDKKIFYVGKGKGDRVFFAHMTDTPDKGNGTSKRGEFIGREDKDSPYLNKDISSVASFGRGNPVTYIKLKRK